MRVIRVTAIITYQNIAQNVQIIDNAFALCKSSAIWLVTYFCLELFRLKIRLRKSNTSITLSSGNYHVFLFLLFDNVSIVGTEIMHFLSRCLDPFSISRLLSCDPKPTLF